MVQYVRLSNWYSSVQYQGVGEAGGLRAGKGVGVHVRGHSVLMIIMFAWEDAV